MKLTLPQLTPALAKSLASVYIICGDETLLAQETAEQIRSSALQSGFAERISVTMDSLFSHAQHLSLFSSKQLLELDLTTTKLNAATGKILHEYAAAPPDDKILLIRANKLDSKTEQTQWYKQLDKTCTFITVWPITLEQMPAWIMQRVKKIGMTITQGAALKLAALVEGNLLAAAQEIEKISLLGQSISIDENTIDELVTDLAHFDIFTLVDSALSGNKQRSLRILDNLAAEDIEPTLILWALTREIRVLADIAKATRQGKPLPALFSQFRIWDKRQPAVRAFLQRHAGGSDHRELLLHAAAIDRVIKGAANGNVWDELQRWIVSF